MQVKSNVKNLINHVALVLDGSGSMASLKNHVITIADQLVETLAEKSKETDQETRVSLYVFEDRGDIQCHTFDKDVLRMPSLKGLYRTVGQTPLIDATLKSVDDLKQTAVLYGDHAFLIYVLTDGAENASTNKAATLEAAIKKLEDNWTLACFVPNNASASEAKRWGFPNENVQIWEASQKGLREVGETITRTVSSYYTMRSQGVRGSRNLFTMDLGKLSTTKLAKKLKPLNFGQYRLLDVKQDTPIAEFIETELRRPYKLGEGYYQLVKPEKVQAQKGVAIFHKKKYELYAGDAARQMIGLPDYEVKVGPEFNQDFDIFIQSTSTNRKLLAGQKLVVMS